MRRFLRFARRLESGGRSSASSLAHSFRSENGGRQRWRSAEGGSRIEPGSCEKVPLAFYPPPRPRAPDAGIDFVKNHGSLRALLLLGSCAGFDRRFQGQHHSRKLPSRGNLLEGDAGSPGFVEIMYVTSSKPGSTNRSYRPNQRIRFGKPLSWPSRLLLARRVSRASWRIFSFSRYLLAAAK